MIYQIELIELITGNPIRFTIGNNGVLEIKEHPAQGEGDKWYYDVILEKGESFRFFNVDNVHYKSN